MNVAMLFIFMSVLEKYCKTTVYNIEHDSNITIALQFTMKHYFVKLLRICVIPVIIQTVLVYMLA